MLLHELLSRSASTAPESVAVIEPQGSVTYRELDARASDVARRLQSARIGAGARVILALENSAAFVACYFGIVRAGGVVVPVPPGPRSDRLLPALRDCTPAACIVDQATWPMVSADGSSAALPCTFVVPPRALSDVRALALEPVETGRMEEPSPSVPTGHDLAAIIYTSGSTGAPRGVMLTHANICANTSSIVEYLRLTARDRVMVVLPFYYVYGLSLLHTHLAVGGAVVLDNRFAFPNVVLNAMRRHAVTGFAGVPSTFAMLLHRSNLRTMSFPALRYVTQAGGPMPPARLKEWLRAMPDVPFYVMYGATEASARLTYLPPSELTRRPGSIGRAIPGVEVRVLGKNGTVAAVDEVGELVARGPNISPGYWNCPEETQTRFGPEGYWTGDLGYADADGFLYLVGRRGDMIKVGGHRVSAREIEDVVHEHPAVHEAAVVPAADDLLGEVPVAHVVPLRAGEAQETELLAFCRTRLADHKVPARVVFHEALPKNGAGKIDKRALVSLDARTEVVAWRA